MKISRLALHGFSSAFPGVVDLPLATLDAGVYAVVGGNGQGKTTLLEAVPGALFRQLPSRNGEDPVTYATGRDSSIEVDFTFGGPESYRARLNLDGAKKQTDAVLEVVLSDGTRAPLNNGQRSTYDAIIAERFPSFDLFINSAFAAQGRGDEFTRRKPSQRKDLFVEFLALRRLLTMAESAKQAADLWDDSRLRLEAQIEALARDTAPAISEELDRLATDLQATGGRAEGRQGALRTEIADLEARAAAAADQVAAYTTAQSRVRTLADDLTTRRAELDASRLARGRAAADAETELAAIDTRRDTALRDITERIAGNEKIRSQADEIRTAVATIAQIDADLERLRGEQGRQQADVDRLTTASAEADRALHAFAVPEQTLNRARSDATLLETVPCGGAGAYAACQFLLNATAAQARIAELEAQVAGVSDALTRAEQTRGQKRTADGVLGTCRATIAELEKARARHTKAASYEKPLIEAETRLAELQQKQTDVSATALRDVEAAERRHHARTLEFDTHEAALSGQLIRLNSDHHAALEDLERATTGNSQAVQLQAALTQARQAWDTVTETLATVRQGTEELRRRRERFAAAVARTTDLQARLDRVRTEQLEWRDLAKALGKGGLPDLEIDAAGPTISALTNQLLVASFGPRFSVELVTQTAKTDGGMKDDFTVRVFDNDTHGGWRDISQLSGGQKVIVQEALMAAIASYVNERSPRPMRTLFRDETGAALDADTAPRYVAMLRRVRELGAFHAVYFVTHNRVCAALADAQIQVGDGAATIALPPFAEVA